MISLKASAKINLNLQILGKRADGYHELVSLVGFSDFGDQLHFSPASEDSFTVSGRDVQTLQTDETENLIIRARDGLRALGLPIPPTEIHLDKHIPIGGGLGGGSSDAAATLRGLVKLYDVNISDETLHNLASRLGADVPVCLSPSWQIMSGIGDRISEIAVSDFENDKTDLMPYITLANPNAHVSTADIFADLQAKTIDQNTILDSRDKAHDRLHEFWNQKDFASLISFGNDLTKPAMSNCPRIKRLLEDMQRLANKDSFLDSAMSGSGASCFALFSHESDAQRLADALTEAGYWAIASQMRVS